LIRSPLGYMIARRQQVGTGIVASDHLALSRDAPPTPVQSLTPPWVRAMRVWLLKTGEPLPVGDHRHDRLLRMGILAQLLVQRGHEVLWWTSTYDHFRRVQRFDADTTVSLDSGLVIRLLRGRSYRGSASLRRMAEHRVTANKFYREAASHPEPPDLILSAWPTIEMCERAVRYGQERRIPVVLDVRDRWPDLIPRMFPALLRPVVRLALLPMYRAARTAVRGTTAVVGNTDNFVNEALRIGGRTRSALDRSFAMGYSSVPMDTGLVEAARGWWEAQGVPKAGSDLVVCFFGAMSRHFDMEVVLTTARSLHRRKIPIRFVLCGEGPLLGMLRKQTLDLPTVIWPGFVDAPRIKALLEVSSVGLAPYVSSDNFVHNIPNKPAEYLHAGVPVALSLGSGALSSLLSSRGAGFSYGGRADELERWLLRLHGNPNLLASMRRSALDLFVDRFDAAKIYSELIDHLEFIQGAYVTHPGGAY
jgi:glycosyltransferase involved in cell wall biosynthesis